MTLIIGMGFWTMYLSAINEALQQENALWKRLDTSQRELCEGTRRVNEVCEDTILEIMQRLGLDRDLNPLVTTALWRRVMKVRVSEARILLHAKDVEGKRLDHVLAGGGTE